MAVGLIDEPGGHLVGAADQDARGERGAAGDEHVGDQEPGELAGVSGLVLVPGDPAGADQGREDRQAGGVDQQVLLQERHGPGCLAGGVGDLRGADPDPESGCPLDRVAKGAKNGLGEGGDRIASYR